MDELSTRANIDEATWDPIGPHSRNGIEFYEEMALVSNKPNHELAFDSAKTPDKVSTQSIKQKNIFDGAEQKFSNESNDVNFNTDTHLLNDHFSDAQLPKQESTNLLQNIQSNSSERIVSLNPNQQDVIKRLHSELPSEGTAPSNSLNSFKKMSSSGALRNIPENYSFDFTTNKLTIPNKCLIVPSAAPISFASSSPGSLEVYYNTKETDHNNLLDPRARKLEEMSSNLEQNKKALLDLDREFIYLVKKMLNLLRDSTKSPLGTIEMDESEIDLVGSGRESSVPNKKSPKGSVMKLEVPLQRLVLMGKKENKLNSFPQNAQMDDVKFNSLKGSVVDGESVGRSAEIEMGESYLLKPNDFESKKHYESKSKITKSEKTDGSKNVSGGLSLMIFNQNDDQPDGQKKSAISSDFGGTPIGKEGKATGSKKVVLLQTGGKSESERKYAIAEDLKGKDVDLKMPTNRRCLMKMKSTLNGFENETQGIGGKVDVMQCGIDKSDKLINSVEESLEPEGRNGGKVVNLFGNLSKYNFENKSRFSKHPKEMEIKGGLKETNGHQEERTSSKKDSRSAPKGKKKKTFCKLMSSPFQWMDRGKGRVRPVKCRERAQANLNGEGIKELKNNKGVEGIKTSLRKSFEPELEQNIRGFNRKNCGWANDIDPELNKREFIPTNRVEAGELSNDNDDIFESPEARRDFEKNIRLIKLINPSLIDENIETLLRSSNENSDEEERNKTDDIPMEPSDFETGDLGIIGKNGIIYPLSAEGEDQEEGFGSGLRNYDDKEESLSSQGEKVLSPLLIDLERFADKLNRKKRVTPE